MTNVCSISPHQKYVEAWPKWCECKPHVSLLHLVIHKIFTSVSITISLAGLEFLVPKEYEGTQSSAILVLPAPPQLTASSPGKNCKTDLISTTPKSGMKYWVHTGNLFFLLRAEHFSSPTDLYIVPGHLNIWYSSSQNIRNNNTLMAWGKWRKMTHTLLVINKKNIANTN